MALHPNQLRDPENIETRFFLPTRKQLEENKDKDPEEQTDHIQAKMIKSKLQSVVWLTIFLRDRGIYIGLDKRALAECKGFIWELHKNLKDLISERENVIKEFKSSISINVADFQKYGSSDYVKDIVDLLNTLDREWGKSKNKCTKRHRYQGPSYAYSCLHKCSSCFEHYQHNFKRGSVCYKARGTWCLRFQEQ